jgi:hypothetical protein
VAAFWIFAPRSLVEVFAATTIAFIMEAESTSEKSVIVCQTTQRRNPEESHFNFIFDQISGPV